MLRNIRWRMMKFEDHDVTGEEDDDVEEEESQDLGPHFARACRSRNAFLQSQFIRKFSGKAAAQNLGPHFVRACAVEMHLNISQEPLYTEIHRKNAAAQLEPRTRTHCASRRGRHFLRATSYGNLREKTPRPRT